MLQAVARIRGRCSTAEVVVIGRGSARARLEALVDELGLRDCTRFTGFISREERDAMLASSRVCVCPSEKEGWGLTVIEANAVGTPVVATDAAGLRDSVRHGETGFLVAHADVDGFAERIAELEAKVSDLELEKQRMIALQMAEPEPEALPGPSIVIAQPPPPAMPAGMMEL